MLALRGRVSRALRGRRCLAEARRVEADAVDVGRADYGRVYRWMAALHKERCDAILRKEEVDVLPRDVLLCVEHEPVFTLGRKASLEHLRFDPDSSPHSVRGAVDACGVAWAQGRGAGARERGAQVLRVERGGEVTYHGPGQLTLYPVFSLPRFKKDIRWFLTHVEDAVIAGLRDCGVVGTRDARNPGVWVGDAKIAAVGIAVSGWATWHGVAVNVLPSVHDGFRLINPCGLGLSVTSIAEQLRAQHRPEADEVVWRKAKEALLRGFADSFQLQLHHIRAQPPESP
jgi:lipoyl(octanoyl) transferase